MTDDVDFSGARAPFIKCPLKKGSPTPRGSSTQVWRSCSSTAGDRRLPDIYPQVPDSYLLGWQKNVEEEPAAPQLALSGV